MCVVVVKFSFKLKNINKIISGVYVCYTGQKFSTIGIYMFFTGIIKYNIVITVTFTHTKDTFITEFTITHILGTVYGQWAYGYINNWYISAYYYRYRCFRISQNLICTINYCKYTTAGRNR